MKTEELIELALEVGFDHAGELNMGALDFRPEVRDMCSSGRCRAYGCHFGAADSLRISGLPSHGNGGLYPVPKVHLSGPALPPSGENVHFHGGLRFAGK